MLGGRSVSYADREAVNNLPLDLVEDTNSNRTSNVFLGRRHAGACSLSDRSP